MPVITEKNKALSFKTILAAAEKMSIEEKHLLKLKLFGEDIINEARAFDKAMRKSKKPVKKSDDEIVAIVRKIRAKNASK